jgi:ABC-2 type transport system permease protein
VGLRDTPLAAFVELRGRLILRRLAARGGTAELVARVLSFLVLLPAAVIFAALVGLGAWRAARAGRGLQVDIPVTAILFGIWQAWTAVSLSMQENETVDLGRFLVYPLRPGRVHALGLAASVLGDPFALFWCVLLGGAFAGAAVGRPGAWLIPLAITLALFAAATVAYVALLQELVGRLLRGRSARAVALALLYAGLGLGVAVAVSGPRIRLRELLATFQVAQWLGWPGALAAGAARRLFSGEVLAAVPHLAALLLSTLAAGWAAYRLALSAARSGGESRPAASPLAARGWPTERLPGAVGPLLERELKQLVRHPLPGVLLVVLPAFAGLVAWKAVPHIPVEQGEVVRALPLLGFALYAHLATQMTWLNGFGWDRGGARALFLAPVDLGEVLLAKNLAAWALSAAVYAGCAAVTLAVGGLPPAWALLAALTLHAGAAPWLFGAGNFVTILSPRATSLTLQRAGQLPALSGLAGMVITSSVAGLFALPVLAALWLDQGWVLPAAWAVLGLVGLAAWRGLLGRAAGLAHRRREPLLAAVTGDDH